MTLQDILVPTYRQMLTALSQWLDKGQGERGNDEADRLMASRLAPEMFPLSTQVRFACVQALEGMHRLLDRPFPAEIDTLLEEGRNGGDRPGTVAEAQHRISETLAAIDQLASAPYDTDEERPIVHALPMGLTFEFKAAQYARDWAVPQFYFHVMTAYAILRSEGVALGKADYVMHAMAYLREDGGQGSGA